MLFSVLPNSYPSLESLYSSMPSEVQERCIRKVFPANTIVMKKGDEVKQVYIICSGSMRILNEFENGRLYAMSYVGCMTFLGDLELLSGETAIACTVETVTECEVMQIPIDCFLRWFRSDHIFSIFVAQMLAKKLYPRANEYGENFFYSALYGVIKFLIKSSQDDLKNETKVIIKKKRQEIADFLGISLRSVNRAISKLKAENLITVKAGKINVNKSQISNLMKLIQNFTK